MSETVGEDILDDALGQCTASLVLLQDDFNADSWLDLAPLLIRLHFQPYVNRDL
jgi:hypothetical protein